MYYVLHHLVTAQTQTPIFWVESRKKLEDVGGTWESRLASQKKTALLGCCKVNRERRRPSPFPPQPFETPLVCVRLFPSITAVQSQTT